MAQSALSLLSALVRVSVPPSGICQYLVIHLNYHYPDCIQSARPQPSHINQRERYNYYIYNFAVISLIANILLLLQMLCLCLDTCVCGVLMVTLTTMDCNLLAQKVFLGIKLSIARSFLQPETHSIILLFHPLLIFGSSSIMNKHCDHAETLTNSLKFQLHENLINPKSSHQTD